MNERTKSIHSLVFLLQKNNCCEALLPVFLPRWRFYYVKKTKKKGKFMDFEQFKEELASSVKEIMYSKYGMEVEVEARTMEKMNSSYEALTVKPEDSIIGVNLNATALYQQYGKGIDIDVITSKAAELAESALNSRPDFDIDSLKDYSKMKETLTMEVVSAERNAALLETVPHRIMEDMAVVYRFEVNTTTTERGSILVTNQMLDQYAAQFKDEDYRVFDLSVNTFNDSYPSAYHHQIGGYNAAKLRRYQDIIDFYLSRHINTGVLNMLNTRYVVVPGQDGQPMVQRNPDALGNAWFVNEYKLVDDANAEILALNELNPADTAVIDKRFAEMVQGKNLERDSNSVIVMEHQKPYNPDYVVYKSKSSKDQLAVFSEVYYAPDWRAYIDGKPADYFRANYILRAMVIPAGEHKIEFKNEAPLLHKLDKIAIICSILFVLAVAGSLVLYYRKPKKS